MADHATLIYTPDRMREQARVILRLGHIPQPFPEDVRGVVADMLRSAADRLASSPAETVDGIRALIEKVEEQKHRSPCHHPYNKGRYDASRWFLKELKRLLDGGGR